MQKNHPGTKVFRQALFAFAALFMLAACDALAPLPDNSPWDPALNFEGAQAAPTKCNAIWKINEFISRTALRFASLHSC
jgi:uncharacterized lipoprotein YajG